MSKYWYLDYEFIYFSVALEDEVLRIAMHGLDRKIEGRPWTYRHWEFFEIINAVRTDNRVRVVVIEGANPDVFWVPQLLSDAGAEDVMSPPNVWTATTGIIRLHEAMVDLDRPIVAKVNGDAIGWGSSVAFASDFIIAREDARFADHHMGMGEVQPFRTSAGMVPGDGGLAHIPAHMSPTLAKEYLMLARVFTGRELADRGVINYAVPADELDARVEQIVAALLKRSAYALAWTKRVAGQHIKAQMQLRLDAATAYQLVNIYQLGKYGDQKHLE